MVGVSMVRSDFEIAAVPTNVSDFETCERGCEAAFGAVPVGLFG